MLFLAKLSGVSLLVLVAFVVGHSASQPDIVQTLRAGVGLPIETTASEPSPTRVVAPAVPTAAPTAVPTPAPTPAAAPPPPRTVPQAAEAKPYAPPASSAAAAPAASSTSTSGSVQSQLEQAAGMTVQQAIEVNRVCHTLNLMTMTDDTMDKCARATALIGTLNDAHARNVLDSVPSQQPLSH